MPIARVQLPDGRIARIEVPEGTTPEQVQAYAEEQERKANAFMAATEQNIQEKPQYSQEEIDKAPSGFVKGLLDPINGLAQLAYHAVPDKATQFINDLNNKMVDMGIPLERIPAGGLDQSIAENERVYQASRAAEGDTDMDWDRLGGNVLATLPAAAAMPAGAAGLGARTAQAAVGGGLFGAAQPVTEGDFWTEKGSQTATGAMFGGAMAPAAAVASRMVKPLVNKGADLLIKEGARPTFGQALGGVAKATEEKLRSIPVLGDFITYSHKTGLDEFNRLAYNRALNPIGKSADDFVPGQEGVAAVKRSLSEAYDSLLPKMTFQADNVFASEVNKIKQMMYTLPKKQRTVFNKVFKNEVAKRMTSSGLMNGSSLKTTEEALGKIAKNYQGAVDPDQRILGDAIKELQAAFRRNLARNSPGYAEELKAINKGYANYAVIRGAAKMANAQHGFTPAQLQAASRAADKSVGKGRTATGQGQMQDLADAGRDVLAQSYPDSGTAGRALLSLGALGAGFASPVIPASLFVAGMTYTRMPKRALLAAFYRRPEGAAKVAEVVRASTPALGFAGGALSSGFNE